MTMLDVLPTFAVLGVPSNAPVVVLNWAQVGLLEMENFSVRPLGSDAVGVKA